MGDYAIQQLDDSTLEEQVGIFFQSFSPKEDYAQTRQWWITKHYQNPAGKSIIYGAFDQKKLIGLNAFMPMDYQYQERKFHVVQSCESGVLQQYRRHGIWAQIVRFAMDDLKKAQNMDLMIGFPNVQNSYHGFLKLGWHEICRTENLILVNNGPELFKIIFHCHKKIYPTKVLELLKSPVLLTPTAYPYDIYDAEAEEAAQYTSLTPVSVPSLMISAEWLQWKCEYRHVRICMMRAGSKVIGRCFYAIENFRDSKMLRLFRIDTLENAERKMISAAFLRYLCHEYPDMAFIRLWVSVNDPMMSIYRRLCLLPSRHKNPFIVYPLKENIHSCENLIDAGLWCPTLLDLD